MGHLYTEDDIRNMYQGAVDALTVKVRSGSVLVFKDDSITKVAQFVVDWIVRSAAVEEDEDISTIPGLDIERVKP